MDIAIVKYNAGNLYSVVNAFRRLGVEPVITDDAERIAKADKVVFPGQGSAQTTMAYLRAHKMDELIRGLRQPVLGICVGQQLLCRHSEEGNVDCIGIFPADVRRFRPTCHEEKVPAMGWPCTSPSPRSLQVWRMAHSSISSTATMCHCAPAPSPRPTTFSPTPRPCTRTISGPPSFIPRKAERWASRY